MTRNHIVTFLIGALVLIATPSVSVATPAAARQWSVDKTYQIKNETEYELFNNGSQIGYDKRTFGVDLGRGVHNGGFFFFVRQAPSGKRDRDVGPIRGNDNLAIFNTKTNRYLMFYARGDTKAELEWTNEPIYEWHIHDQWASADRVHFALFNSRVKKYLVYKSQRYGINLGWFVEPPQTVRVPMYVQQFSNGWMPYVGTFGRSIKGNVISVQNAQKATVMFVKTGHSTSTCSDPNATTVRVAPLGTMTADQMKLLYGFATPRLPINFRTCIKATKQSIFATFLYITYKPDN